jgi:ParB-like nuclease domain
VPPQAVEEGVTRDLLDLEEATDRLRPFARRYVGIRPIAVDAIVGTDGRGRDFDREFRARRTDVRARRRRVEHVFSDGGFPPIAVQKLGDAYFVVDGHHRVAVARRLGVETIDAEVVELTARWTLRADAGPLDLRHAEQERVFMAESGLGRILPSLRFAFSRPVGYVQLLETIQVHGYRLLQTGGQVLDRGEVARDWYSRIYVPTLETIREARLDEVCPEVTDPDRFLWVYEQRRELSVEHGPQQLPDVARRVTLELARRRRGVGRLRWRRRDGGDALRRRTLRPGTP